MKKQVKVVMLPTEKASDLLLCIKSYTEHINTPAENSDIKGNLRLGYGKYVDKEFYQPQNLYLLSDEEIKEGDKPCWCYNSIKNTWNNDIILYQGAMPFYHYKGFKKIIATTDESLGLPRPSNEFLKKYCELGGIDKVLVEYNEGNEYLAGIVGNNEIWNTYPNEPKIAPDNTITIYPIK